MTGNHDSREALLAAFPRTPSDNGFVHYVLAQEGWRLIVLDTLDPGRHGGGFCEARADWLRRQLSADSETPTWIVMHHPPFEAGIAWLDSSAEEPWIARFAQTVAGFPQVRGILAGHLHRAIHTQWNGLTVSVCPSTAPAVALDLNPVDPNHPDGRELITAEPPGYALHYWNGAILITHVEAADGHSVLARFDESLQSMVKDIMAERPEATS